MVRRTTRISPGPRGEHPDVRLLTLVKEARNPPRELFVSPFVVTVLKLIFTIMSGLSGLMVFEWGLRAVRNRFLVAEKFRGTQDERPAAAFLKIWAGLTFGSGISMMLAAILVWFNAALAIGLAIWPPALSGFCWAAKRKRRC